MNEIRTERRFGVTSQLNPEARRHLFNIRQHDGWPVVLDVIEMVCIELEGELINTAPEDEAAILAKHKMSKAAWQIFEHVQVKIEDEISRYISGVATKPPEPLLSDAEREELNIMNPLNFLPDENTALGETGGSYENTMAE
jgi:hypothetical protein